MNREFNASPTLVGSFRGAIDLGLSLLIPLVAKLLVANTLAVPPNSEQDASSLEMGREKELFRSPLVKLRPRSVSKKDAIGKLVDSAVQITGIALSRTEVVISTRGLAAALSANVGDAGSPEKLALRIFQSARQQFWMVEAWDGQPRRAKLVAIARSAPIALIELEEELPPFNTRFQELAFEEQNKGVANQKVEVIGISKTSAEQIHLSEVSANMLILDPDRAILSDLLPANFEGALVRAEDGDCIGILVGSSTPGAPRVLSKQALQKALLDVEQQEEEKKWLWSIGGGIGTTFMKGFRRSFSYYLRADLFYSDRWNFSFENSYNNFKTFTSETNQTYTTVSTNRHMISVGSLAQYLLGPNSAAFRFAIGGGLGAQVNLLDRTTTVFTTGNANAVRATETESFLVEPRPFLQLGGDFVNLSPGPWNSLKGTRVGYRFQLTFPETQESTHTIFVTLQL